MKFVLDTALQSYSCNGDLVQVLQKVNEGDFRAGILDRYHIGASKISKWHAFQNTNPLKSP